MECSSIFSKRQTCVNFSWLPIKVHYFLLYGTVAGVSPFLTVIGKDIGLSTTAVGITFSLLPITVFLCKPIFGYVADYIQNTKMIIMCLMIVKVILSLGILLIPSMKGNSKFCVETHLQCISNNKLHKEFLFDINEPCARKLIISPVITCNISYTDLTYWNNTIPKNSQIGKECNLNGSSTFKHLESIKQNSTDLKCLILLENNSSKLKTVGTEVTLPPDFYINCDHKFEECLVPEEESRFYDTYQFWIYLFLIVISCNSMMTAMTLTDVSCYEVLGVKRQYFGRQRLWGTASTGIITLLSGYLNDLLSKEEGHTEYFAGFYIMIALFIINIIILANMKLPKASLSQNIISDVKTLFKVPEFIIYGTAAFFIGAFSSLNANFLFWHLTDLGASQTLLGLTIAIQCLVSEIPFFFFSGWFITNLGYFNCLTCVFSAFALRFGIYSLLENPWFVLPVETLHGVTYGIFYASFTAFSTEYAPEGTEATVLGILCGIYEGLGIGSGSLLGGLSLSKFGGSQTFLIASCISIFCTPTIFISQFAFKRNSSRRFVQETNTRS